MWEREGERETHTHTETETGKERQRQRETVRERERQRERELPVNLLNTWTPPHLFCTLCLWAEHCLSRWNVSCQVCLQRSAGSIKRTPSKWTCGPVQPITQTKPGTLSLNYSVPFSLISNLPVGQVTPLIETTRNWSASFKDTSDYTLANACIMKLEKRTRWMLSSSSSRLLLFIVNRLPLPWLRVYWPRVKRVEIISFLAYRRITATLLPWLIKRSTKTTPPFGYAGDSVW